MALKKPTAAPASGGGGGPCSCPTLLRFPQLLAYMTDDRYDDGSKRQRATITVFVEEAVVKVALNDRQEQRSAYVSGSGLQDVLVALEASLAADQADWRLWQRGKGKKGS